MAVGWWPEISAEFALAVPVSVGMSVGSRSAADVALSVPVSIGMVGAGRSVAAFELAVPVVIGMEPVRPQAAAFGLSVPVSVSMSAVERYAAGFGLSVPAGVVMGAGTHTPAGFGVDVPATPAFSGTFVSGGVSYSDDFNRSNSSSSPGGSWTVRTGKMGINGNAAYPVTVTTAGVPMTYTAVNTEDMYSSVTIGALVGSGSDTVRCDLGANSSGERAQAIFNNVSGNASIVTYRAWGGSSTSRVSGISFGGYTSGDVVTLSRTGNVYTCLLNGSAISGATWTDSGNALTRDSSHRLPGMTLVQASSGNYRKADAWAGGDN